MARPDKAAAVAELADNFRESNGAVLTEYRGLSVKQLQDLRRSLGEAASYFVAKNTLTKIAAKDAGIELDDSLLTGPTAIAFIKGDAVEAAKSLRDFAKENSPLVIKGGFLDGKVLSADEIKKLADLESREVLLAKLAGGLKANLAKAAGLFNAPLSQAARTIAALQAKAEADPSVLAAGEPAAEVAPEEPAAEVVEDAPAAEAADAPAEAEESPEAAAEAPAEVAADAASTDADTEG